MFQYSNIVFLNIQIKIHITNNLLFSSFSLQIIEYNYTANLLWNLILNFKINITRLKYIRNVKYK